MKKYIGIMLICALCLADCGSDKTEKSGIGSQKNDTMAEALSEIETEEDVPAEPETEEILPTEAKTEKDIPEATEEEQVTKTEEENEQSSLLKDLSLKDITWDDFRSGNSENVIFYFSFDDGTTTEMAVPGKSMVSKITYKDITGDGKNEVLAEILDASMNTECRFIVFFQIEQKTVTDISPETDIDELKGCWKMGFTNQTVEGYTSPLLRMELIGWTEEEGHILPCTEEVMYIGYKEGKWEIVEKELLQ